MRCYRQPACWPTACNPLIKKRLWVVDRACLIRQRSARRKLVFTSGLWAGRKRPTTQARAKASGIRFVLGVGSRGVVYPLAAVSHRIEDEEGARQH